MGRMNGLGRLALSSGAALFLAACGSADNSALDVAVIGAPDDPFQGGVRLTTAGQLVRAATVEGLVAFDEQGRVIPALADRWIVTDDGQSYIFRLREGNWANGDPITGDSARKAIEAALDSLDGTPLAFDLSGIDEIRAMAGRVIEIRLRQPMPYLLQLLAQPELGLYHEKRGAGPMTLEKAPGLAQLQPIDPARLGLPAVEDWSARTRRIELHALGGQAAVDKFNDGDVDLVLGGRIQDFTLTRSVGILRGTIQLDPVLGLFGLQVMNDEGFLADPANREALAMAIDREALMAPFGVGGWGPTTRVVAPSLAGDLGTIGERWSGQSLDERRQVAKARVHAWQSGGGGNEGTVPDTNAVGGAAPATPAGVHVRIWLPEGEGSQVLFDRLSSDLGTIGVTLERAKAVQAADLMLVDDVARYPRAAWYLNRLSCAARRGLCSPEADARVAEADKATSPPERAALLAEAEAELTAANVFIPFGTPIRWSLVRGSVDGFAANSWGWHPLMPLARPPR
ncbi:peptide/nickel transport system substrate-binding protein/oligopeptide transport system substrate-binding protein [Novosphingobium sp. CF614]|uniref:ABC transporter substrate-binding protein n=1 Tax=Novosphingobium sp. CF614 TaxID=1884364 RepID=UPI0008EE6799|nr:ABC transporter substrate-binding protein [Novosphingobium sp. CF614]SFF85691.1 peptide/nickel transport system substrate-binding protein/oligopeptide transport system substrate-binding protein [Novosphingobium sp. CF614]